MFQGRRCEKSPAAVLISAAITPPVDAIVSGDRDLLDAGLDQPRVLTPRQLLDMLAEAGD